MAESFYLISKIMGEIRQPVISIHLGESISKVLEGYGLLTNETDALLLGITVL